MIELDAGIGDEVGFEVVVECVAGVGVGAGVLSLGVGLKL